MSGASVAAKINKAMKKVGGKIGFPCTWYRPDFFEDPIDNRNMVAENVSVAWSVDESFAKNPTDELAHYLVYASDVQNGDIFVSDEQGITLIVTEVDPIRVPAGIRADDRMDVLRPTVTPQLDKKTTLVSLAANVPCAVKYGKAAPATAPQTSLKSGSSTIEVWSYMPAEHVAISDVIEVRGNRFLITSVNSSEKGTKISAVSTTVGK